MQSTSPLLQFSLKLFLGILPLAVLCSSSCVAQKASPAQLLMVDFQETAGACAVSTLNHIWMHSPEQ